MLTQLTDKNQTLKEYCPGKTSLTNSQPQSEIGCALIGMPRSIYVFPLQLQTCCCKCGDKHISFSQSLRIILSHYRPFQVSVLTSVGLVSSYPLHSLVPLFASLLQCLLTSLLPSCQSLDSTFIAPSVFPSVCPSVPTSSTLSHTLMLQKTEDLIRTAHSQSSNLDSGSLSIDSGSLETVASLTGWSPSEPGPGHTAHIILRSSGPHTSLFWMKCPSFWCCCMALLVLSTQFIHSLVHTLTIGCFLLFKDTTVQFRLPTFMVSVCLGF